MADALKRVNTDIMSRTYTPTTFSSIVHNRNKTKYEVLLFLGTPLNVWLLTEKQDAKVHGCEMAAQAEASPFANKTGQNCCHMPM